MYTQQDADEVLFTLSRDLQTPDSQTAESCATMYNQTRHSSLKLKEYLQLYLVTMGDHLLTANVLWESAKIPAKCSISATVDTQHTPV